MRRDRAFTQVQLEYEQLRRTHSHLSHKELWQQAEEAAASSPDALDEDVWRSVTQRRSPRRAWMTALIVVLIFVAVAAFRFLYSPRLETDRAAVAAPVGTTTIADVLRDYESYEGQVWTLEGVVGGLDNAPELGAEADPSPRPTVDPLTTTTRPAGSWVTINEAVAFPSEDQMDYTGDWFLRPQLVSLTFTYPTQTQVRDGDEVRVTCRIVGPQAIGFMEGFKVAADVCRNLVLLDD